MQIIFHNIEDEGRGQRPSTGRFQNLLQHALKIGTFHSKFSTSFVAQCLSSARVPVRGRYV